MKKEKGLLRTVAFGLALSVFLAGCETQSTLTRGRIKRVEKGLLRQVYLKGTRPEKLEIRKRMEFYRVPGLSIAVLDRGRLEWAKTYGIKDVRTGEPVTGGTIFQAGALGQPLTAAAALLLVDRGAIDLDADVNTALRSWKSPVPVSLRDLLSSAFDLIPEVFPGYAQKETLPDLSSLLEGREPAANAPVSMRTESRGFRPSEAGYLIVQNLLGDVTGKHFPEMMEEILFEPLKMTGSSFHPLLSAPWEEKAASGHLRSGAPIEGKWRRYPESAAKGLWTTASDYAAFMSGIVEDAMGKSSRLLRTNTARLLFTPGSNGFGFGFFMESGGQTLNFSRRGETSGYSAFAVMYPGLGQGAVILTNSENGSLLIDEIVRAVSEVYRWPSYKTEEKTAFRLDPSIYAQYAGRYEISPEYALDVTVEDYYLVIQPTGQARTRFYAEGETLFFSVDPFIRIQFRKDYNGSVVQLVIWQQGAEQKAGKVR